MLPTATVSEDPRSIEGLDTYAAVEEGDVTFGTEELSSSNEQDGSAPVKMMPLSRKVSLRHSPQAPTYLLHQENSIIDDDVVDDAARMSSSLSSASRAVASSTSARRFSTMTAMQTPAAIFSRNMRRASASYGGPSSRQSPSSHSSGASPSSMPPSGSIGGNAMASVVADGSGLAAHDEEGDADDDNVVDDAARMP